MSKKVIYQVLPRFWANGKFSDWDDSAFRRLSGLGFSHIWYTGIIRHACGESFVKGDLGSPYAISDYYDVNPYLADEADSRMSEFEALVERTHAAGLGVLIDFVPNHIARNYSDIHGGIPHFDWCDYDWTDTWKIDYSDRRTFGAMLSILRFWAQKGVDGFRCDMVELVPVEFFSRVTSLLRKEFPQLIFIGEAYDTANYRPLIEDGGFDLLYDKSGAYDILRGILSSGRSARELTWNWQRLGDLQEHMLNFLENHDEQRLASSLFLGSPGKAYAALAFSMLFNKASFMLYAGQETGEDASESDNGRTSIFNDIRLATYGKPVLRRYADTLELASSSLFREGGNWDLCYCNLDSEGFDPDKHFAFLRYDQDSAAVVACNFSGMEAGMTIRLPGEFGGDAFLLRVPAFDYEFVKLTIKPNQKP